MSKEMERKHNRRAPKDVADGKSPLRNDSALVTFSFRLEEQLALEHLRKVERLRRVEHRLACLAAELDPTPPIRSELNN